MFKTRSYTSNALRAISYQNNHLTNFSDINKNNNILYIIREETQAEIDAENNFIASNDHKLTSDNDEYSDSYAHSESFTLDDALFCVR